jgi:hypothetical protein
MEPNPENDKHPDAWHYAWQRTPSLGQRIWDLLLSGAVFLVLGLAAIVLLTVKLGLAH